MRLLTLCTLHSYILNRGWIDRSDRHIPTYNEITSTKASKNEKMRKHDDGDNDNEGDEDNEVERSVGGEAEDNFDEDDFDDLAETFESSYNFRFEEP